VSEIEVIRDLNERAVSAAKVLDVELSRLYQVAKDQLSDVNWQKDATRYTRKQLLELKPLLGDLPFHVFEAVLVDDSTVSPADC